MFFDNFAFFLTKSRTPGKFVLFFNSRDLAKFFVIFLQFGTEVATILF